MVFATEIIDDCSTFASHDRNRFTLWVDDPELPAASSEVQRCFGEHFRHCVGAFCVSAQRDNTLMINSGEPLKTIVIVGCVPSFRRYESHIGPTEVILRECTEWNFSRHNSSLSGKNAQKFYQAVMQFGVSHLGPRQDDEFSPLSS